MSLVVVNAVGMVTVQDRGRPGRMHEAVPPGGALVRELHTAANRHALNEDGSPALEVLGELVVRAIADTLVGSELGARMLRAGDELVIASEPRRVAYLAIRGGVEAPLVLGGRGTQLSAGLGALVRPGDRIDSAGADELVPFDHEAFDARDVIRVLAGPDPEAFPADMLAKLTAAAYRVHSSSNRVGTRLEGPAIPRAEHVRETSRPMVIGAIEIPGDGAPIVLGPEHPTTGGYPILAVISHADLGAFFAIRPGGSVRFTRTGSNN
ncbi:MAG: Allophanate hydrolase 2 subunit 2 [Myxococcales bacterium]|nr:Allophanate hydrolase 2 subunit 2 [Myxococcales bacterium]